MKTIKLLFQGDSITDAGRDYADSHHLGNGYVKYAAGLLQETYPDVPFEFIDLGISGNQTKDLKARLEQDFVAVQPDVVSILIGINDVWHYAGGEPQDNAFFEENYRTVLEALKTRTNAKIMMMEPFLVPIDDKRDFRDDLGRKIEIIRQLAREYADVYLPTDGLLQAAFIGDEPLSFAEDGVHPTEKGAKYIAGLYVDYIRPIIDSLLA